MFFEFLSHLVSFDLPWLAGLLLSNLHYLFLFAAPCFFFFGQNVKKTIVSTIVLFLIMWAIADLETLSGWAILVGGFLGLYYITKIAVMTFANDLPFLKDHLIIVTSLHGYALMVIYNIFLT